MGLGESQEEGGSELSVESRTLQAAVTANPLQATSFHLQALTEEVPDEKQRPEGVRLLAKDGSKRVRLQPKNALLQSGPPSSEDCGASS